MHTRNLCSGEKKAHIFEGNAQPFVNRDRFNEHKVEKRLLSRY
ncbi:hypothetical protein LCAZH_2957 [Lacticaseibacillus paracasei]|nr:hypothetical protein LCAZH_2957 [Lacticaseibacillus paracasei]